MSLSFQLVTRVKGALYELVTNQTTIFGRKFFTVYENLPYAAFLNIPYAVSPLSDLRFKPPKGPHIMHKGGIYDFSKENIASSVVLNEDLTLSVYMPISNEKIKSFPIAVWVYEGSYEHGPDFLIEENILVVVVNFRISILGFLNTDDEFAKGNMGAKDVLMCLKWIRSNIYLFHGDINKVTVIGSGDGAYVVSSLLVSSAAEDLFKRVIIHGGSALSPVDYGNHNLKVINKLYQRLYGNTNIINKEKLYGYLSKAPVETLMAISHDLFDSTEIRDRQRLTRAFGCTVENDKKSSFIYEHPLEVYHRKFANYDVDVMFGYCNYDALLKLKHFINRRILLKYLNFNFQYLLPFFGDSDEYDSKRYKNILKRIKDFYFINGTITKHSLRRYVKYHTDQVVYPLVRQARLQSIQSKDVYLYRFSYNGCFNVKWKKPTPNIFFNSTLEGLLWEPLRVNQTIKVLSMDKTFKMVNLSEQKRIDFWDKLKQDLFEDNA
ncbi:venom carboxylesterase-6-like [Papilio machaon]|uniref:venom carboxylesterase-6-like n=1 Tax=Papilio machaon TaxID=76193 RepID=UPI001E6649C9|nr:venom carboxylesterase-6-like [Papilio machaon]